MKPPPVEERFRVTTFVPKELLGETIAALTRLGLTEVNFDLVADIKSFAKKAQHVVKAEAFLAEWMKEHASFRALEAVRHFRENGRTAGAAYTALRMMSSDGRVRKLGEGMYQRPDIKAISGPKKKAKPHNRKPHKVSSPDFVLRAARRNHGRFNSAWMKKQFDSDGRPTTGVGPTINKLLKGKAIKRVGEGEYVLLTSNGSKPAVQSAPVAEATHG
jgi:hypothetical protein